MTKKRKPVATKRRIKAIVAYDGTTFAGWQVQPGRVTVQSELERAIFEITGQTVRANCSGRTDQGVHALGQVVHFDLVTAMTAFKLVLALNVKLPPEIRILKLTRAKPDFDARFSATGKEYRYFVWNGPQVPPHLRHFRALIRPPLDVKKMRQAAAMLVGKHDFAGFSANPGHEREGTVREVYKLDVRKSGHDITIIAQGNGFLYKMVRSLAGFLIRVGSGELPPEFAQEVLHSKTRTARVPTASPSGLFLWRVFYAKSSRSGVPDNRCRW